MGHVAREISPTAWTIGSSYKPSSSMVKTNLLYRFPYVIYTHDHDESLKAYLAPTGLVSEPRGDLTCRGV